MPVVDIWSSAVPRTVTVTVNGGREIPISEYPSYFTDRQTRLSFRACKRRGIYPSVPVFLLWSAEDWDVDNGYPFEVSGWTFELP